MYDDLTPEDKAELKWWYEDEARSLDEDEVLDIDPHLAALEHIADVRHAVGSEYDD